MDLPGLKRFLAVVEAGSLNKAADRLSISQPALTKSMQALEERLGVELFVRDARGVRLTAYGHAVLNRARLIDSEMRRMRSDLQALRDLSMGEVNVGAPPGPGFHSNILPAATKRLLDGGRRVSVNYSMGTREQLLPALRDGQLDFIVAMVEENETTTDLIQEPLFEDRNSIIVDAGHPLLARGALSIGDLVEYPWVTMSESLQLEKALRAAVHAQGLTLAHGIVRSDPGQFVKALLHSSQCIGLIRYDICRVDTQRGQVTEIRLGEADESAGMAGLHTMGMVYRREAGLSPASLRLIAEIRAECEALAGPARPNNPIR